MREHSGRLRVGLGVALVICVMAITPSAWAASAGTQIWAKRYDGPASAFDVAGSLAVSPNGSTVFVTGYSKGGSTTGYDYATVAYSASTGAKLWAARFNGPASLDDYATSLAVSPDSSRVFVTGYSKGGRKTGFDYATVAYSASTGAAVWTKRYNGPASGDDISSSLAVSPNGSAVFVTGHSGGGATGNDYATVAYSASTGTELWTKRYDGPASGDDKATSLAVSPNGSTVLVTGN